MAKESGSGSGAKRKTPGRRNGVAAWLADQRNLFLFVGIVVVVVGGGIFALAGPSLDFGDDDDDNPARIELRDVSITAIDAVEFDKPSNFLRVDVAYEPADEEAPRIECAAEHQDGTVIEAPLRVWAPLAEGLIRKPIELARAPDGQYMVRCTSGSSAAEAQALVEHDPDFLVSQVIAGRYEIPTFEFNPERDPEATGTVFADVRFTFYESGRMVRELPEVTPIEFEEQPDGSYAGTIPGIGELEEQHVTVTFDGDDAITTIENRWKNGKVEDVEARWRRLVPSTRVPATETALPAQTFRFLDIRG